MKRIILILISVVLSVHIYGQEKNLTISDVKFIEFEYDVATSSTSPSTIVVPAGKVLKIESIGVTFTCNGGIVPKEQVIGRFYLNEYLIYNKGELTDTPHNSPRLPIWLPAGTYNMKLEKPRNGSSTYSCNPTTLQGFVSALEFNLTTD